MAEITVPTVKEAQVPVYDLFFSHIPNSTFIFPNGEVAAFQGGRYATDNPAKAAYLQYEIDAGNPYLYRKEGSMQVSKEDLAPDAEYRKRVIAEYLASQEAAKANPPEMGTSEQGKLNVADTLELGQVAADSTGAASSSAAAGAVAVNLAGLTGISKN